MASSRVPERLTWAVELLDIDPEDQVLEIGCGPGVAVALVCDRLAGGRITALDRSAVAISRATQRNAEHVASGKAILRQVDLAELAPTGQRFDKIFAVNVNLFWVRPADAELRRIKELLRPGGVLQLVYEPPSQKRATQVAEPVTRVLADHGFATEVRVGSQPSLLSITARPT